MDAFPTFAYNGFTPGADSNVYPLYSTCGITGTTPGTAGAAPSLFLPVPKGFFQHAGIHKMIFDIKCTQAGTIKWYKSSDRGTTWRQEGSQAIAAPAATDSVVQEFLVEAYLDFKVEWTNGGVAQATWAVDIVGSPDRAAAI